MKYRIIGDIHGRKNWKELVDPFDVNIFVGDYFDPYSNISYDEMKDNFMDILAFKKQFKDNVILLLGNHDLHYWWHTGTSSTSRFLWENSKQIHELFMANKEEFQMAYSIENQFLVTHAGVTKEWYENRIGEQIPIEPFILAESINGMLTHDRQVCFSFTSNSKFSDYYGVSPQQSCVWIRPESLVYSNVFVGTPYQQIVGHTQVNKIVGICESGLGKDVYLVDVLGTKTDCLLVYQDDEEWKTIPETELNQKENESTGNVGTDHGEV